MIPHKCFSRGEKHVFLELNPSVSRKNEKTCQQELPREATPSSRSFTSRGALWFRLLR